MRATTLLSIIVFCASCSSVHRYSTLPELPVLDMAKYLPAVREQLQPAYDDVRRNMNDAAANGKLGMLLDAHEQYESARACYQRAHILDPRSFQWAYYLGVVQAAQARNNEASASLREAIRINADYAPAHLRLAEILFADGKLAESERAFRALLAIQPDIAAAHYGLGRVLAARGNELAAIDCYRIACELFPSYGAAHYALAMADRKQGHTGEAERHFRVHEENKTTLPPLADRLRAAISDLSAGAVSHIRRAAALEQAGDIQGAISEHESALQADPKLVQAHVNLISLYGRLGQLNKAERHYHTAASLNPNQADCHYNYGVLLFERKDYTAAQKAFEQALHINPYHPQAHLNLGYLFEQQGRLPEALQQYRKAIDNQPGYRMAHFHAGRILANQRKYDEAIGHLLKTVATEDERTASCLYALAATYARAGDRENALTYGRRARDKAVALGQTELVASIDKDLAILNQLRKLR